MGMKEELRDWTSSGTAGQGCAPTAHGALTQGWGTWQSVTPRPFSGSACGQGGCAACSGRRPRPKWWYMSTKGQTGAWGELGPVWHIGAGPAGPGVGVPRESYWE